MKNIWLSFLILLFISCSKEESHRFITNGFYIGYFEYQGLKYYSSIIIDEKGYSEGASGGVIYQKNIPCLTEGRFLIYGDKLIFNPQKYLMDESEVWKRNPDLILNGAFNIMFLKSDSISFSKGTGDKKIVYLLRRYIGKI